MGTLSLVSEADPALAATAMKQLNNTTLALQQIPDAVGIDTAWAPSGGGKIVTDSAIMLENVAEHYQKPNILDVKLGARLWADDSPPAKREKMDKQAAETTSKALGLRIAGMRIWKGPYSNQSELNLDGYHVFEKFYGRSLTSETVHQGFEKFFNIVDGRIPSKNIRRVIKRFIEDLEGLQSVLEAEESRIYSSSLLFVYEGDEIALHEAFVSEKKLLDTYDRVSNDMTLVQCLSDEKDQTNGRIPPDSNTTIKDGTPFSNSALPSNGTASPNRSPTQNSTGLKSVDAATSYPTLTTNPSEPSTIEPFSPSSTSVSASDDDLHLPPIQALKLIDFAHAQWTPGQGPDENLLHGIRNVIRILRELCASI